MNNNNASAVVLVFLAWVAFVGANLIAWITHVSLCIAASKWVLLVVGAIVFPIALVHGYGYWLGFFH